MSRRSVHPASLLWADVDPAQWPLSNGDLERLRAALLSVAAQRSEEAFDDVVTGQLGAWSSGWRWAGDEGSIGGGVVRGWCCASHSIKGTNADVVDRVLAGLADWRAWITHLSSLFDQLEPRPGDSAGDSGDLDAVVAHAVTIVLAEVAEATSCGDAWYNHAHQVLCWYLERWGVDAGAAGAAVGRACAGVFSSWSGVADDVAARLAGEIAADVHDRIAALPKDDVVLRHRALRAALDPAWAPPSPASASSASARDGHAVYIDVVDAARDGGRAQRLREALRVARSLANGGALVDLALVRSLHEIAVPRSAHGFRRGDAFAKGGRERYGFDDAVIDACDTALVEANDVDAGSVVFRAARAYLDLCFFHPFVDGNARAARLVFDLILAREGVVLDDVDALFRYPVAGGALPSARAFIELAWRLAHPAR